MELRVEPAPRVAVRYSIVDQEELAHAYLYLLRNDWHETQAAFIEDVFVKEGHRGRGLASTLINRLLHDAQRMQCYKVICTSRHGKPDVHAMYEHFGFRNHGVEFRMDF